MSPYVKLKSEDERDVPELRLMGVKPNQTVEVTDEQLAGLICQDIWEETKATKSAPKAAPIEEEV
jgi:hypothetical protein